LIMLVGIAAANVGALIGEVGWHRPGKGAAFGVVLALIVYFLLVVWAHAEEARRAPYGGHHRRD
jgi:hypothetical protein